MAHYRVKRRLQSGSVVSPLSAKTFIRAHLSQSQLVQCGVLVDTVSLLGKADPIGRLILGANPDVAHRHFLVL